MDNENFINNTIEYIVTPAINGCFAFDSAKDLANTFLNDYSYDSKADMVNSLINWESSKNTMVGFITSCGGALTIPVGIAGDLYASWVYQARMSAAIAFIYDYDIYDERVKTMILFTILGDSGKEVLKDIGIEITKQSAKNLIKKISGRTIIEINKQFGRRLLTKSGEKGIINLTKWVPFLGGVIGGVFDCISCQAVGKIAKEVFAR